MQVKADLHVHTTYSIDSVISLNDLVFYAKKRGLAAVAITDHNEIEGALKLAKETDFLIIPGTEVSSLNGHVVGLNLRERIPKGLSVEETVDRIHEAGGIAVACHPFVMLKKSIGAHVSGKFNAVETINASAFPFNRATRKAKQIAKRLNLPSVAGTDAHYGPLIGQAYTIVDSELNVESIVKAIANGRCSPAGKAMTLSMRLGHQGRFLWKYLKRDKITQKVE
jgi:predicted metal-dependent phosphoesterase TrpH